MPTYQYACTECDHAFEQVQSFTEDSLTSCPQCEGRLRKIFNAVGVVFKGSASTAPTTAGRQVPLHGEQDRHLDRVLLHLERLVLHLERVVRCVDAREGRGRRRLTLWTTRRTVA